MAADEHFQMGDPDNPKQYTNYKQIARVYKSLGKLDSALIYFNKIDFTISPSGESWSFNEAAIDHYEILRDFEQYEIGNYILRMILKHNHYENLENYEKLKYLRSLLQSYSYLNDDVAEEEIQKLLNQASKLEHKSRYFEKEYIQFQLELSSHYSRVDQFDKAIPLLIDLLKKYKSGNEINLQEDITNIYSNLAFNYEKTKQYDKMLEIAEKAIQREVVGSKQNDYARNLNYAAALMYDSQYDPALSRIDSAFSILNYERFSLEGSEKIRKELINIYSDLARLYFHFDEDSLALKSIDYLINISERNIDNLYFEQSKYLKKAKLKGYLNPILDSLYVSGYNYEFWRLSELLKATVAYDYLNIDKIYSEDILDIIKTYDKSGFNTGRPGLGISNDENSSFQRILKALPNIYGNHNSRFKTGIDFKKLQNDIPKGTALLQYQYSRDILYVIIVSSERIEVRSVGDRSTVNRFIKSFNQKINEVGELPYPEFLIPTLLESYNSIVVIHDENLATLPLDYLINESSNDKKVEIYSSLSSVFWSELRNSNNEISSIAIVNALSEDPLFNTSNVKSLKNIFSAFDVKIVSPKRNVVLEELLGSSLFHFSGHAKATRESSNFSYLILDEMMLDRVSTAEISKMNLNNNLIVLGACETGLGNPLKGEGVMNFARAFIQAGASSVVQTLWEVHGESTHQILTLFYENLIKGQSKSRALWNAKMEFLKFCPDSQKHPYYWAGIVIIGNDEPLKFKKATPWWYWLLIPVMLGTGFYGYRRLAA